MVVNTGYGFLITCIACEYEAVFVHLDAALKASRMHEDGCGDPHECGVKPLDESKAPKGGVVMEDTLKMCRNRQCKRNGIIVATLLKRCDECGGKLKRHNDNGHQPGMFDTPPLVIGETPRKAWKPIPLLNSPTPAVKAVEDNSWTACEDDIQGCPIAKAPKVEISYDMYQEWIYLCKQFNVEWIAYLRGTKLENGNYRIDSYYFPKQKATGAHVDADAGEIDPQGEPTIGAVHSHVGMKAFFSAEDTKHANHAVELVINRDGDMDANVRMVLECGRPARKDTSVVLCGIPVYAEQAEALKGKLREEKQTWGGDHGPTEVKRYVGSEPVKSYPGYGGHYYEGPGYYEGGDT